MVFPNESGLEYLSISDEQQSLFVEVIGRPASSFEIACLSLGANPFDEKTSRKLRKQIDRLDGLIGDIKHKKKANKKFIADRHNRVLGILRRMKRRSNNSGRKRRLTNPTTVISMDSYRSACRCCGETGCNCSFRSKWGTGMTGDCEVHKR